MQRSRTDATIALTLNEGEKVTIIASDNRECCCVGETGWFAVDSYQIIRGLGVPAY